MQQTLALPPHPNADPDGFVTVDVDGYPVAQGSMRAMVNRKTGRAFIIHDNGPELRAWRKTVATLAGMKWGGRIVNTGVELELTFYLVRAKSAKRPAPYIKPDADKLVRAVFDALTGVVYDDDCRVTDYVARKRYAPKPGLRLRIRETIE